MNPFAMLSVGAALLLLPLLFVTDSAGAPQGESNRYIGAQACKNCHAGVDKGEAFDKWSKTMHAKAWETLGGDKAKELGKKAGVDEPQKSEKCLKCHVTAYGLDDKLIKKATFKPESGVQCETCHGPGEKHMKTRMKEATSKTPSPVTKEEIPAGRDVAVCRTCHNDGSPSYQPFCMKERMAKIQHLDPRKQRSKEELEKLTTTCVPDCPVCAKSEKK
jgi:hypothetical protein